LDVIGPVDAFTQVNRLPESRTRYEVGLIGIPGEFITAASGIRMVPDHRIGNPMPAVDTLLIAGSPDFEGTMHDQLLHRATTGGPGNGPESGFHGSSAGFVGPLPTTGCLNTLYFALKNGMVLQKERVPATILTGFLGAGKTTLLNHLLSQPQARNSAVIVNEFGEISIDAQLIVGVDEEVLEINNGRICCTVRADLVATIDRLLSRPRPIHRILVETTGLADPAPIIESFVFDERLRATTELDALVTVVDARHNAAWLALGEEDERQGRENMAAFGMAVALARDGYFEWEDFRQAMIREVADWESSHAHDDPGRDYYECWLVVLERLVAVCLSQIDER
jgi:nitrile hydratase accessory protein